MGISNFTTIWDDKQASIFHTWTVMPCHLMFLLWEWPILGSVKYSLKGYIESMKREPFILFSGGIFCYAKYLPVCKFSYRGLTKPSREHLPVFSLVKVRITNLELVQPDCFRCLWYRFQCYEAISNHVSYHGEMRNSLYVWNNSTTLED